MKRLICCLVAMTSLALNRGILAADKDENIVTGTVVQASEGYIEIDEGMHDGRTNFGVFTYGIAHKPKVGDRVRVHIRVTGRGKVYADKIEKLGPGQAEAAKGGITSPGTSARKSKLSDDEIKQQLLGYWKSPRHGYLIKDDGIIYMLPRKFASSTNRWHVRDGLFYWDNLAHDILTLDDKKCVYRSRDPNPMTFTLIRSTKEEADPE